MVVEYYAYTALSNQSGTLRAMTGIMRLFSAKFGYRMLEDLPTGAFDFLYLVPGLVTMQSAGRNF